MKQRKTSNPYPPQDIYCLFHKKTQCECLKPVVDQEMLQYRLESAARLEAINQKYAQRSAISAAVQATIAARQPALAGVGDTRTEFDRIAEELMRELTGA
jgi:hypothetical protein